MATGSTSYGVTPAGFYAKPLTVIDDEFDEGMQGILGESSGTNDEGKIPLESMAGQLKALMVDGIAANWELVEAAYVSVDPNKNTDSSQDAIAAISGSIRNPASFSIASGLCAGTPLTLLEAGRVVTVPNTGSRFASLTAATIVTATAWVTTTAYVGPLLQVTIRAGERAP